MKEGLSKESAKLLDKAFKVVDSAKSMHRDTSERYICLVNRRLHKTQGLELWSVIGASMALREFWIAKFGPFGIREEGIYE